MRIVIATDAWHPQINGVVRTYENVVEHLKGTGHQIELITPLNFFTVPCPTYPTIKLAVLPYAGIDKLLRKVSPEAIHIATEGPIGHAARAWCLKRDIPFTTSFHTRFPEYIRMRLPVPLNLSYAYLRNFHKYAARTLAPTPSQQKKLQERGFDNVVVWSRGVNTRIFYPRPKDYLNIKRPIFAYAGRVAVEKNIGAFLELDLPGSKLIIGDGPDLKKLSRKYPDTHFVGFKTGIEYAEHMASADVLVFPSHTDTFGIVMLEALACGVPIAAFPVTGPIDIIENGVNGFVDRDLRKSALSALEIDASYCVAYARRHTWQQCSELFLSYLEPVFKTVVSSFIETRHAKNC